MIKILQLVEYAEQLLTLINTDEYHGGIRMYLPIDKLKPLSLALLLAVTACSSGGGGDSSSATKTTPAGNKVSGLFLDAEVEGLSYTTDSGITGQTDENGTYEYIPGEQVSFSVGGVNLGTVDGAPVCTPFDFGAASRNIARFIQSLDADNDPTNGIDIIDANTALANTTIDSDAFIGDDATFANNSDIQGALTTTDDTLIDPDEAQANLDAGTDTTFDDAELDGKLFVILDPTELDIGIISFEPIVDGANVFSIFASETTAAGEDGSGADETWAIDSNGVLTLTDIIDGSIVTVNRLGGSSRSISVTANAEGEAPAPFTLLIPQSINPNDIGGDGVFDIASKIYDIKGSDNETFSITFNANGTYALNDGSGETGTFEVNVDAPNTVTIVDDAFPNEVTFMLILDGDITVKDETTNVLFSSAEIISETELQFNDIEIGEATLKSTISPE